MSGIVKPGVHITPLLILYFDNFTCFIFGAEGVHFDTVGRNTCQYYKQRIVVPGSLIIVYKCFEEDIQQLWIHQTFFI